MHLCTIIQIAKHKNTDKKKILQKNTARADNKKTLKSGFIRRK